MFFRSRLPLRIWAIVGGEDGKTFSHNFLKRILPFSPKRESEFRLFRSFIGEELKKTDWSSQVVIIYDYYALAGLRPAGPKWIIAAQSRVHF